ncbi:MAG: GNAT family N-acetyltransferase [Gemmatimonadaceae bacterium]|nr:GNAT family N-acetyltransferase [Gemmatimonadaceae bacterium]
MTQLETERLIMRTLCTDDLEWLVTMRGDADVMRYIGGEGAVSRERTVERVARYLQCWNEHGLGMFGVRFRGEDEAVGWAGLQPLEETGEIEVGYAFGRTAWGRGLATETARAALEWGFRERGLERIVAVASPENAASRHVMDKLGMKYEGIRFRYGTDCAYHSITAKAFAEHSAQAAARAR